MQTYICDLAASVAWSKHMVLSLKHSKGKKMLKKIFQEKDVSNGNLSHSNQN